jgi:hypothetical protein
VQVVEVSEQGVEDARTHRRQGHDDAQPGVVQEHRHADHHAFGWTSAKQWTFLSATFHTRKAYGTSI